MTREEAIHWLEIEKSIIEEIPENPQGARELKEAYDMAIEALQTEPTKAVPPSLADVYKWERDIALSQLEEYGIGFAEKKRDDLVEVVRCKDCRYFKKIVERSDSGLCHRDLVATAWKENGYCSRGERREPSE